MRKRFFSVFVCFCIIISVLPMQAQAADDYPSEYKNAPLDSIIDEWNFYNRECTSFVAWCLNSRNGVEFTNWYGGLKWGHAKNWGITAQDLGILVDNNPKVGSIAWSQAGYYGHVAWVAAVNGNTVTIEDYNRNGDGYYDCRDVSKSSFSYIHIKDLPDTLHGSELTSGAGRNVMDGDYEIVCAASPNFQLDISGTAVPAANATNVQIYKRSSTPRVADVFTVTYLGLTEKLLPVLKT